MTKIPSVEEVKKPMTNTENTAKESQVFLNIFEILCRLDDSPRIDIHFQNKCYTAAQKISNILRANK